VYTNNDVIGCEIAGALKNVLAIGAGIIEGSGFGINTKTGFIVRGTIEI
jgi:glycerol-3-phosphate dehydrogenase (NAD(P)+)